MVRHVDAVFSQGAFRSLEPLGLPEGTRIHLSVEESANASLAPPAPKIHSPKLAHPEDAADFLMASRGVTAFPIRKGDPTPSAKGRK